MKYILIDKLVNRNEEGKTNQACLIICDYSISIQTWKGFIYSKDYSFYPVQKYIVRLYVCKSSEYLQ